MTRKCNQVYRCVWEALYEGEPDKIKEMQEWSARKTNDSDKGLI